MPIRFGNRQPSYRRGGIGGLFGQGRARSKRGGFPIRLVIGVIIALVAVGGYFLNTTTNPFTGEEQRVGGVSEQQEVALGLNAAPQMVQQMGGRVSPNDAGQRLVSAVGSRLLTEGGIDEVLREKDIPYEFTFTLLEDDELVNAFALPGGPIFITEALFNRLENEAQLAGVLGHEIGHVIHRHGLQAMSRQNLGQQLVAAVAVGSDSMSAAQMGQFVNQMTQLSYGRDAELQSDDYGLQALVNAGYDPREMVRVMEILRDASGGGGGPEFASSHPAPQSRIDAIKAWVAEKFPDGVPQSLSKGRSF